MNERSCVPAENGITLKRSSQTMELLKDHNAFILLTVIALRARQASGFNLHGLKPRQVLLGDCRAYGMSLQQYRSAKKRLAKWSLARFHPTNEGTIATLLDGRIYDIDGSKKPACRCREACAVCCDSAPHRRDCR
jgi:hypothetical protein